MSFLRLIKEKNNSKLAKILPLLLLFILPIFIYSDTINYQNTYLDDDGLVENAKIFSGGVKQGLVNIFTKDVFLGNGAKSGFYRPVLVLSFCVDRLFITGEKYALPIHHFVNILLHSVFCVLLLFFLISFEIPKTSAYIAALLFSVFPPFATAIAWLGGRNDVLIGIFLLSACIFQKAYMRQKENGKKIKYLLLFSMFLFLAIFTKETALAFLPLSFLIYMESAYSTNKKIWDKNFTYFFLSLLLPVLTYLFCRTNADLASNALANIKFISLPSLFVRIIGYFFSPKFVNSLPVYLVFTACLLALTILIYAGRKKIKNVLLGLAWFFCFFIPPLLSTGYPNGWFFMTHRMYVPICGLMLAIFSVPYIQSSIEKINAVYKQNINKKTDYSKASFSLSLLVLVFAFFSINTVLNSQNFASREKFVTAVFAENAENTGFYYGNLGDIYFEKGWYKMAEHFYKKCIENKYDSPQMYLHLAAINAQNGKILEAYDYLEKCLKKEPDNKYAIENMQKLKSLFSKAKKQR